MGVYRSLDGVPDRYRLGNYEAAYADRDVWAEWVDTLDLTNYLEETLGRAEREWKAHMDDQRRHHALARPEDAVTWATALLDGSRGVGTAYNRYWVQVEKFYTWLQTHVDHPHVYHPFWMAVVADRDGPTGRIWNKKIEKTGGNS
jgi:hypothetical protein